MRANRSLRLLLMVLLVAGVVPWAAPGVARAATTTVRLRVVSARSEPRALGGAGVLKDAPISRYRFIINHDNVGDHSQPRASGCRKSDPGYPASCHWPSIQAQQGYAPVVAQGTEADLSETVGLTLPPGNYLISVVAEGFKLDGAWFSVPIEDPGLVTVALHPLPLPTATLRAKVFEDTAPTNSAPDIPAERGLAGFRAIIADQLGEITTDLFGNPLCTEYVRDANGEVVFGPDGTPTPIPGTGGGCYSDADGDLVVPNLGPNRYEFMVAPPDSSWIQTTTLEGRLGWDTWAQEGYTGYDTEFQIAGEPFPWTMFGFVRARNQLSTPVTGEVQGRIVKVNVAVPYVGGQPYNGQQWGGFAGARVMGPVEDAWISLNDLQRGDAAVYIGRANSDGTFRIRNVPDGNYFLGYWDESLLNIFDWTQVTVRDGQVTSTGDLFLTGWFMKLEGTVFVDTNANGKRDPGEPGLAGIPVVAKRRTNSLMDRQAVTAITDSSGRYVMENLYPLVQWLVIETYSDRYYTTGYTFQAWNQPDETTVLGQGVDVNVLPVIGQSGRLDWGVLPYDATGRSGRLRNGGIAGTVSYDTTRNELDPRFAAVENWQVGIPGLTVNLYAPIPCTPSGPGDPTCVPNPAGVGYYRADPNGALARGPLLNTTTTEQWQRPTNCTVRDVDGNPVDPLALPSPSPTAECVETPQTGAQFGTDFATVDGNFGFATILRDPLTGAAIPETAIPAGDYLVEVVSPSDILGRPVYTPTREEDINVFDGDQYVPQIPPSPCAGALHTVDVAGVGSDGSDAVDNPAFAAEGGSPYEGQRRPLCDVKLVTVTNGKSVAPAFTFFTRVPLPGRWFGYIIDDLTISMNPQDTTFGEKLGLGNMPIGIYDYSNRLVKTVSSDPNGVFEVLLPSSTTVNCPSPSGVCANNYRIVGNDPGVPGRRNPNYNPQYRTIAATFEIFPGDITIADLAPTQIGVSIQAPGSQLTTAATCALELTTPQLFAVDRPYVNATSRNIVVRGLGFGASQGSGQVRLGPRLLPVQSWSDRQITVRVPDGFPAGPFQLMIRANNGQRTVNGLTVHVLGAGYNPRLYEVGPGRPYPSIQAAIDASAGVRNPLIVVYPGGVPDVTNPGYNPQLAYFENLIIDRPLRLQGVGPGGVYADGSVVDGSVIDGGAFGGDTPLATAWRQRIAALLNGTGWDGNQAVYEGATITVFGRSGEFSASRPLLVDGFSIQGGNQQGFPNNINQIGGTPTGLPPNVETQGGALFANAYVRYLQLSNNIVQSNGGAYGAIRLGTPHLTGPNADNQNENARILYNRIIANGGTNLAGALGIFNGADGYEVAYNDFCGNTSAEYGGAISHYGYSPNGSIHHNRIFFNRSYDEGGGVMIAGELPATPGTLSRGAGPVSISSNIIQSNLANDDGGGLRFLMAGNFTYNVVNNIIANNVSTHEGGGVALNDAPAVRFVNNTVIGNLTTATATTSDGSPAPAGLSTVRNSAALQATLGAGAPIFSNPLLFNNVFWNNRAGSFVINTVSGIGLPGDPSPINYWDLGVSDGSGTLAPSFSLMQRGPDGAADPSNRVGDGFDPAVLQAYTTSVAVFPWRTLPGVVGVAIVAVDVPPTLMGDYHLAAGSPAVDMGTPAVGAVSAPLRDVDGEGRPAGAGYDAGADEVNGLAELRFPATPVLDSFNRAQPRPNNGWAGNNDDGYFRVTSNRLQVRRSGLLVRGNFGADQEAYFTFAQVGRLGLRQGLLLKVGGLSGGAIGPNSRMIRVAYNALTGAVLIETLAPGQGWRTRATLSGVTFWPGDVLGARAYADGTVVAYRNGVELGRADVTTGANPWPLAYSLEGGRIGISFLGPSFMGLNAAAIDDFGGGTLP
ncbi:MAG: hypothetical protein OHK0015_51490 [Chloroflexi bacterium OHK40]